MIDKFASRKHHSIRKRAVKAQIINRFEVFASQAIDL